MPSPTRFLLFAGEAYYPDGGAEDYIGGYSSIIDAVHEGLDLVSAESGAHRYAEWWNVLDTTTGDRLCSFSAGVDNRTVWRWQSGDSRTEISCPAVAP